jgi:hypothetical protein
MKGLTMDELRLAMRENYERECALISKRCEEIEASTSDYWVKQEAIKENNRLLTIAHHGYMKAYNLAPGWVEA